MDVDEQTRVAIVGVGQSDRAPSRRDVDYSELAGEAVDRALLDAGVQLTDIDHAVTAALDFVDGRTIASMSTAEVVGSFLKPEGRLCGDGTNAVHYAWAKMRTGGYRIGLIVAHAKESQGDHHLIESAAFDPFAERRLEPDGDVVAGLSARRYYEVSGHDPQAAAEAVANARAAGADAPAALDLPAVSADDVLGSEPLASPLRRLDRAPRGDGACALVVVSADLAADLAEVPVWIAGASVRTDAYWMDRDLASTDALEAAASDVVAQAGWTSPPDLVELSAQYSFQALQFSRAFEQVGTTPTTPSGGWLAGGPQIVSGLDRVAACVDQLRGRAGSRQLPAPRQALAHGFHGLGAQTHGIVALEGGAA